MHATICNKITSFFKKSDLQAASNVDVYNAKMSQAGKNSALRHAFQILPQPPTGQKAFPWKKQAWPLKPNKENKIPKTKEQGMRSLFSLRYCHFNHLEVQLGINH